MKSSLPNSGKTLQRPWVTVIQEEWDSSTEVINDINAQKMCGKRVRQFGKTQRVWCNIKPVKYQK